MLPPLYLRADGALPRRGGEDLSGQANRLRLVWTDGPRLMRLSDALLDARNGAHCRALDAHLTLAGARS